MSVDDAGDRLNLAVCRAYGGQKSPCRFCQIPCDWTTREYRATRTCPTCYDQNLGKLKLVRKPQPTKGEYT